MSTLSGGPASLSPQSPVPTFAGAVITVLGFLAIAVAWAGVAGKDDVADQIPYLVSGVGFGLGLVLVGVTVISVAAKRRDAAVRVRQMDLLADAIAMRSSEAAE